MKRQSKLEFDPAPDVIQRLLDNLYDDPNSRMALREIVAATPFFERMRYQLFIEMLARHLASWWLTEAAHLPADDPDRLTIRQQVLDGLLDLNIEEAHALRLLQPRKLERKTV
jgi:hypothetical protein